MKQDINIGDPVEYCLTRKGAFVDQLINDGSISTEHVHIIKEWFPATVVYVDGNKIVIVGSDHVQRPYPLNSIQWREA